MSAYEKLHLGGFGALTIGYAGFAALMMDGMTLGSRGPGYMALLLLGYLAVLAVALGAFWITAMRADNPERTLPDEREERIEDRADRVGYRLLDSAVAGLVGLVLADAVWGFLGSFSLTRPEAVVFALVTVSTLAGLARFGAGYLAARRG